MTFGVITKIEELINVAIEFAARDKDGILNIECANSSDCNPDIMVPIRAPVFTLGEILILDENGREMCGHLRKPSKWRVECKEFGSPEGAIQCATQLIETQL